MARLVELRNRVMDGVKQSTAADQFRTWKEGVKQELGRRGHKAVEEHLPRAGEAAHEALTRAYDAAHGAVDSLQPRLQKGLHKIIERRTGIKHEANEPLPEQTMDMPRQDQLPAA